MLEDDVVWQERAGEMLAEFMPQVPKDWDQIYLGGQHLREPVDQGGVNPAATVRVLRAWNVNRTHAFALQKKAIARVHQHIWHAPDYISKEGGWHIDHQLGIAHERGDWSVYAPSWWLAGQDEDRSNISGNYNPRLCWHPSFHTKCLPIIHIPVEAGAEIGEARRWVHPGNTLKPGTLEDAGLEMAAGDEQKLKDWLVMIAREVLDMHRLPAWQSAKINEADVTRLWPAGVRPLARADLAQVAGYPWNGLFDK